MQIHKYVRGNQSFSRVLSNLLVIIITNIHIYYISFESSQYFTMCFQNYVICIFLGQPPYIYVSKTSKYIISLTAMTRFLPKQRDKDLSFSQKKKKRDKDLNKTLFSKGLINLLIMMHVSTQLFISKTFIIDL